MVLYWMVSHQIWAQDTITVYKSDLIPKLMDRNKTLKIANQEAEMARSDYNQSKALYLPSITVSHTAIFTNNPLMAFGSKLNQQKLTEEDFDPALLNDPDQVENYATDIMVQQPLLNLDGIQMRKAAKVQSEAMALKADRTREYLEFEVLNAYMQLQLAYEAVKVLKKAKSTALSGVKFVQDYYDQGLLKKTDLLSVQVRSGEVENRLSYAISSVKNSSDYLAMLLGENLTESVYIPEDRLIDSMNVQVFEGAVPARRKDIMAKEMAVDAYGSMLNASRFKMLPRINAFGNYQLFDDVLFGFNASGYTVGVSLSWALFDGNKSAGQQQKARAAYEKAQVENSQYKEKEQLELNKAGRRLSDAGRKVELALISLNQSAENYRITSDRFREGLEKTTDYLQSETTVFQKELEYKQAIFEYNLTIEYLKFLTK